MKLDKAGYDLIKGFEGCVLHPYLDQVGVPTIGYGNTQYEDGRHVKMSDSSITKERADELFKYFADKFAYSVERLLKKKVTQNKFNALVSIAYNIGIGAFSGSTLLKKVNKDACDESIRNEFAKWNKGRIKGELVVIQALALRRKKEADLYFT